jgi:mono/diheme cytochrome c family protein
MKDSNYKNQLENIKPNPGTLFGLLYPYVLVIILGIGIYYLSHMGDIAKQKVPPVISVPTPVSDLTIQQPKTIPPVDVNEISIPTPELIELGSNIYKNSCAACHGNEGTGVGPGSVGLNPAPRNFTVSEGWVNGKTISGIYTSLHDGIPNSAMIAYDFLTPKEKFGLAHYIRSEFIADPPMDDEMDLFALDLLYNLSAGVKIPGQMPTESAAQLIVEQNSVKIEAVTAAIEKIKQNQNGQASLLIENVTDDLQLALSALENSNKWRVSEDSFIKFLTINVNQNGFNGNIFNLKSEEWNTLFNYFNNIL